MSKETKGMQPAILGIELAKKAKLWPEMVQRIMTYYEDEDLLNELNDNKQLALEFTHYDDCEERLTNDGKWFEFKEKKEGDSDDDDDQLDDEITML